MPVTSMCCVHKLSSDIMLVFIHTLMGVRDIMWLSVFYIFYKNSGTRLSLQPITVAF